MKGSHEFKIDPEVEKLYHEGLRFRWAEEYQPPSTHSLVSMDQVRNLGPGSVVKLATGEWAKIALHYVDPPLTTLAFRFGSGYSIELQEQHLPLTVVERT